MAHHSPRAANPFPASTCGESVQANSIHPLTRAKNMVQCCPNARKKATTGRQESDVGSQEMGVRSRRMECLILHRFLRPASRAVSHVTASERAVFRQTCGFPAEIQGFRAVRHRKRRAKTVTIACAPSSPRLSDAERPQGRRNMLSENTLCQRNATHQPTRMCEAVHNRVPQRIVVLVGALARRAPLPLSTPQRT
jgi:hypothetical protein